MLTVCCVMNAPEIYSISKFPVFNRISTSINSNILKADRREGLVVEMNNSALKATLDFLSLVSLGSPSCLHSVISFNHFIEV